MSFQTQKSGTYFWRMLQTKHFPFPLTSTVLTNNSMEVNGKQNSLVTNIFQKHILYSIEERIYTGLNMSASK